MWSALSKEPGDRWHVYARTQLFATQLVHGHIEQAEQSLSELEQTGVDFRQLCTLIPAAKRAELAERGKQQFASFGSWYGYDSERVAHLKRLAQIQTIAHGRPHDTTTFNLMRAHRMDGHLAAAIQVAQTQIHRDDMSSDLVEDIAWCLRENGQQNEAIAILDRYLKLQQQDPGLGYAQLAIERARIEVDLGKQEKALQRIREFLASAGGSQDRVDAYGPKARLLLGVLLDDTGRHKKAMQEWQQGFVSMQDELQTPGTFNHAQWTYYLLLGALSGELDAETLEPQIDIVLGQFTEGTSLKSFIQTALLGQSLLQQARSLTGSFFGGSPTKDTVETVGPRRKIAEQVIAAWKTPRGHALARDIAYERLSFPRLIREPPLLMAHHIISRQARADGLSPVEDELLWDLSRDFFERLLIEKNSTLRKEVFVIGNAWQRDVKLAPALLHRLESVPSVQVPFAYFFGLRSLQRGERSIARTCFELAATSEPESSVSVKLAREQLELLSQTQ